MQTIIERERNIRMALRLVAIIALIIISAIGSLTLAFATPPSAPSGIRMASTLPATTCPLVSGTRTCDLWAKTGTLALPDAVTVPIWGYSATSGGAATLPGPTLIVNVGEAVNVVLHNVNLPSATSLDFPGQTKVPDTTGVSAGASKTYSFTASDLKPGTYLYEAGLTANGQTQVAMGLFGALIVRPTACANCAYNASTTFEDEALLVFSEIDPAFNAAPTTFNMRNYAPKYWLINGKAFPNSDAINTSAGNRVLLRYLNAGTTQHSIGLLGLRQNVLANDGKLLLYPYQVVAETIPAGASLDALATIPSSATTGTRFAVYEAANHLDNNGAGTGNIIAFGGMLTFLTIPSAPPSDTVGPTTSNVAAAPNPTNGSVVVTLSASVSDVATGNSNITAAEYFTDTVGTNGNGALMTGTFGSPTANISATISTTALAGLSAGNHTLYVHGRDAAGNWGATTAVILNLDRDGPTTSGVNVSPNPTNGSVAVTLTANVSDVATGNSNIVAAEYFTVTGGVNGSGTPMSGAFGSPTASITGTLSTAALAGLPTGNRTLYVHGKDAAGNWGATSSVVLNLDRVGPTTSGVSATPNPANGTVPVILSASVSDVATGNSNITAAEYFTDTVGTNGNGAPMTGTFGSPTANISATISTTALAGLPTGNHTLHVHGKDAAGNWGAAVTTTLTITSQVPNNIFADSFESGNFAAWSSAVNVSTRITVTASAAISSTRGMSATISGGTSGYVQDNTPSNETTYHARFYFNPHSTTIGGGGGQDIFMGRNTANQNVFRVQVRINSGQYQIRAMVSRTGGTTNTNWYTITNAYHPIEIAWQSASSASFSLYIDGTLKQTLTGLNTSSFLLDTVRLGPPASGIGGGTNGTEYFDNFVSTRTTYIGP